MFFKKNMKTWDITVFFYLKKNKVIKAFVTKPPPKNSYEIKSITFKMKPFTWGFYVYLNQECARNGDINNIDYLLMKEKTLLDGIVDWDITDDNGNKVKVTKENIFNLSPIIVDVLLSKYDELCFLTKKEKKQLMLDIHSYYTSQLTNKISIKTPPFETIELALMERFHWPPDVIDKIPYKKLQRLFLTMNQREISTENALRIGNTSK